MANMREIRTRIDSVKDTMKITNAMYLISSSKLRKARNNRDAVSPYFESLQSTISDILQHSPDLSGTLFDSSSIKDKSKEDIKRCYIIITSDKGLAGSYSHNVFRLADEYIEKGRDNTICMIGYMAKNYYAKNPAVKIDPEFVYPAAEPAGFRARNMAEHVIDKFQKHEYDEVYIVYTKMINSMIFEAKTMQILPLTHNMFGLDPEAEDFGKKQEEADPDMDGIEFSKEFFYPSPEVVLNHIVPNYVKGLIYGAMVESYACEQNARMTAMDSATSNAREMIDELSLMYNRARQAAITQELTEIVSGASSQE